MICFIGREIPWRLDSFCYSEKMTTEPWTDDNLIFTYARFIQLFIFHRVFHKSFELFNAKICDMLLWRHLNFCPSTVYIVVCAQKLKYAKKCWILICWAVCDMMMFYDSDYHITLDMILYYIFMFEKIEAATRRLESVCRIHLQNLFRFMEYKLSLLNFIYLRINQNNQSNIFNIPLESHFICIKKWVSVTKFRFILKKVLYLLLSFVLFVHAVK